ncbi:hypothetical protein ACCO45_001311 [Purpureocillium lilacinum]|uniref:Uncharacterized protein n=1 Tax=Purpureocillium lilacinum TaxID=33203 RepID=A0ACC4E816_PURLI
MKATIVTFALLQGLALAAPGRKLSKIKSYVWPGKGDNRDVDISKLIDDPETKGATANMLDSEHQDDMPWKIDEYQRDILEPDCFPDGKIHPDCEKAFFDCGKNTFGPDFGRLKYFCEKKWESFHSCIEKTCSEPGFWDANPYHAQLEKERKEKETSLDDWVKEKLDEERENIEMFEHYKKERKIQMAKGDSRENHN